MRQDPGLTRREVLERYGEYGGRQEKISGSHWLACRRRLAKPLWHLFHGEKGGKKFRRVNNVLCNLGSGQSAEQCFLPYRVQIIGLRVSQ